MQLLQLALLQPWHCRAGIVDGNADGLFGTAVATMGMLSTAAFILTMDMFGPIAGALRMLWTSAGTAASLLAKELADRQPCGYVQTGPPWAAMRSACSVILSTAPVACCLPSLHSYFTQTPRAASER